MVATRVEGIHQLKNRATEEGGYDNFWTAAAASAKPASLAMMRRTLKSCSAGLRAMVAIVF